MFRINIIDIWTSFFDLLLIPLSWLPAPALVVLRIAITFFVVFLFGKVLKWLWDALPIA